MAHGRIEKTNAARLLDRAKIAYELIPYRVDEEHLAATHVAEQLGEDIANKKADLIPMKELLPVTGYIRGGCSPIGMKKAFPTYIHASASEHPFIYISAGVRGLQLKLAPADLAAYVRAAFAEI